MKTETPPKDLLPLIWKLINNAQDDINRDKMVTSTWFIVHRPSQRLIPIGLPPECEPFKEEACDAIRRIIRDIRPKPDCVIFLSLGWQSTIVPEETDLSMEDIVNLKVREVPGAKEVVSIVVETRDGVWIAGLEVENLGKVVWSKAEVQMGPLFGYLPPDKWQIN